MKKKDYFEQLALIKILLEAKFNKKPENMYVQISPHTARFCNQAVDDLIGILEEQGKYDEIRTWKDWRRFSNRADEKSKIIRQFDYYGTGLAKLSEDDKVNVVMDLCSPFTPTDEEKKELLELLNAKINEINNSTA